MLFNMGRPERIVFIIESLIFDINRSVSILLFLRVYRIEVKDLLWPLDMSFSDLLNTNLGLSLLMA